MKRRIRGRTNSNRSTLIAPERLNIETPKNIATEDTLIGDHRAMERGRTTSEYARGKLNNL
jgi:hypothetical protein